MRCLIEPKSVMVALKQSAAVFSGEVLEMKNGGNYIEARLRVERYWKGVEAEEVSVFSDSTTESPHYRVGQKYLVFAGIRDGNVIQVQSNTRRGLVEVTAPGVHIRKSEPNVLARVRGKRNIYGGKT